MDNYNHNKKQEPFSDSSMCNTIMSRTFSEYDIEEFLKQSIGGADSDHQSHSPAGRIFSGADGYSKDLTAQYRNPDNLNDFPNRGGIIGTPLWYQNPTPKNSTATITMDSQSSMCAESPISDIKSDRGDNNVVTATSDDKPSDEDDTEIEAGQCEQSNDQMDVKRNRRKFQNRESARRSRQRKEANLTELEQQVENLRGEYSTLFKQLTNASQQFKEASTNNRVLKSDVEALRAKVKLAEDIVARGSLTSSLSHLLQNHLATPQLFNGGQTMSRMVNNVSPTITVRGDEHGPHSGLGQHVMGGLGTHPDIFNANVVKNGINIDAGSCVSDIWPFDTHNTI